MKHTYIMSFIIELVIIIIINIIIIIVIVVVVVVKPIHSIQLIQQVSSSVYRRIVGGITLRISRLTLITNVTALIMHISTDNLDNERNGLDNANNTTFTCCHMCMCVRLCVCVCVGRCCGCVRACVRACVRVCV